MLFAVFKTQRCSDNEGKESHREYFPYRLQIIPAFQNPIRIQHAEQFRIGVYLKTIPFLLSECSSQPYVALAHHIALHVENLQRFHQSPEKEYPLLQQSFFHSHPLRSDACRRL